jgi:hypothetical protein
LVHALADGGLVAGRNPFEQRLQTRFPRDGYPTMHENPAGATATRAARGGFAVTRSRSATRFSRGIVRGRPNLRLGTIEARGVAELPVSADRADEMPRRTSVAKRVGFERDWVALLPEIR